MPRSPRIFLDTSVIFAAVLSTIGGARQVFRLGEAGVLQLIVGPNVLRECEDVVRRKAPETLPLLAILLERGKIEIAQEHTQEQLANARTLVSYDPDAYVLAEAIGSRPDWFITHDKTHFLENKPAANLNFQIGTPGDLLQSLADEFSQP
jgi:predicted nucleic acid-binding protein